MEKRNIQEIKYPKGSEWRKWDLQVHTPNSIVHQYSGSKPWERFIREMEQLPPEFKVIGINDYIFLDGYKHVLDEKAKGRFQNIELFLPVIELRLDKFGGSESKLSRVNYHIIFSDELNPELIEQQFLNALTSKYELSPTYNGLKSSGKWKALPTKDSLIDLGKMIIETVPEKEQTKFGDPLLEGFNNLCLSLDAIENALNTPYFKNKVITAVGKTEWADIKWNDQSIAEKKTIINGAKLVFISSETVADFEKAKRALLGAKVNDRLLDCSDAHSYCDAPHKDRIGKCFTWIKADPTFEGLLQVINEPDDRVFIGDLPPKLTHVRNNKTKYIQSICIQKNQSAILSENWFDNTLPLNPGLIAIIGNKGKGKSALTDTIGLLCNTRNDKDFTFLSSQNFRQAKDNKAKHFHATLTWESDNKITRGLEEYLDEQQPELAKYIPQNYLEKICTQLGKIEESEFDRELKKVIFSHVEAPDRLNKASLDDLIAYKTSEANEKIQILKNELHDINEEIIILEGKCLPEYKQKLENLLAYKKLELEAHDKSKPIEVKKPELDLKTQEKISKINEAINVARGELSKCDKELVELRQRLASCINLLTIANRLFERLDNLERQFKTFLMNSKDDFTALNLPIESILKISLDKHPLLDKIESINNERSEIDEQMDLTNPKSLVQRQVNIGNHIEHLQNELDEPNKIYQAYIASLNEWENQRNAIIGDETNVNSLSYLKKQIEDLNLLPGILKEVREYRLAKASEIHTVIKHLTDTYRSLYTPVNRFMETHDLGSDKFQLNFNVEILNTGFENNFFDFIHQGVTGTFYGSEDGYKKLKSILLQHDFNTETGIINFLVEIIDSLENDKRINSEPVKVSDQIRKGKNLIGLYDYIFSLDYLRPRYSLRMGDKELSELSPGERGTLLLIFYLLVDKDNIPLIIDQPEENLDNQTVYELLVPCMKEAKQHRQIIIVTHNPNLAVVCDAEQVICAELNKKDNYRMRYLSGSIENPIINKAIIDVLEGTRPAFDKRDDKYLEIP